MYISIFVHIYVCIIYRSNRNLIRLSLSSLCLFFLSDTQLLAVDEIFHRSTVQFYLLLSRYILRCHGYTAGLL